jgi:hypothetical protein
MATTSPLRRELLLTLGALFAVGLLVAILGILAILPSGASPRETAAFIFILVAGDLTVLFVFAGYLIRNRFLGPVDDLVADVREIAGGSLGHRVRGMPSSELQAIEESVNAMADRLVRDQRLLAENVASLEATNRELVEARSQVVQTARLASVGTLAAGIAHEVGNPLGAILVYLDLARSRARSSGDDTDILDSIRQEAERIDTIVRSLLDYARPKTDDATPSPVAPVLERVRDLLRSQGHLGEVEDEWELGGDDGPVVLMAPHRLEQVMVNLLLNALHELKDRPDGWIRIRVGTDVGDVLRAPARREGDPPGVNYMHRRRLERDHGPTGPDTLFTADRVAVITVEDNGPGVEPDHVEHLFDPFFTTKAPGEGTGLGLAVCARLVEGMGGRIEAGNRDAGGAAFTIRLPAGEEGALAPPAHRTETGEAPRSDASRRTSFSTGRVG